MVGVCPLLMLGGVDQLVDPCVVAIGCFAQMYVWRQVQVVHQRYVYVWRTGPKHERVSHPPREVSESE